MLIPALGSWEISKAWEEAAIPSVPLSPVSELGPENGAVSLPSPAQGGNSFPSIKGLSTVLQELHFCSHHVQMWLGKRRNPPDLLYSHLKLHFVKQNPWTSPWDFIWE